MRYHLLISIGLLLGMLSMPATYGQSLRVATEGNYPPFSNADESGRLVGFDVDIAEALCTQMQVRCDIQAITWTELIPRLEDGSVDMIVASMARTPEREQRVDFTDYYYRSHSVFAGRIGVARDTSPEALAGLRLVAMRGTIQAEFLQQYYNASPLQLVANQLQAFDLLLAGKADLVLSDTINLLDFLQQPAASDFDFVGEALTARTLRNDAHIAVRKGDTPLRERLNTALTKIRLNGVYDRINRQYFPFSIY